MKRHHFDTSTGRQSGLYFGNPEAKPSLVFAHANGMHARAYAPLLERVSEQSGKTIFALDLRGHGKSGLGPLNAKTADWQVLARDYLAAVNALGLSNITLAGHSLGASVSLIVSTLAPSRIKNLCLFEPVMMMRWLHFCTFVPGLSLISLNHPMVQKAKMRQAIFASKDAAFEKWSQAKFFQTWEDGFLEAYIEGGLSATEEGNYTLNCPPYFEAECFRQLKFWPYSLVENVSQPVYILVAEKGSTLVKGVRSHIEKQCPSITVEIIPNSGHFLPMQFANKACDALVQRLV